MRKTEPTDAGKTDDSSNGKIIIEKESVSDGNSAPSSNGYQSVPIVIETVESNLAPKQPEISQCNMLCVDPRSQRLSNASAYDADTLDIRSYISQSRSDVSPFARSSSYRSQYGRTSHIEVSIRPFYSLYPISICLTFYYFCIYTHHLISNICMISKRIIFNNRMKPVGFKNY